MVSWRLEHIEEFRGYEKRNILNIYDTVGVRRPVCSLIRYTTAHGGLGRCELHLISSKSTLDGLINNERLNAPVTVDGQYSKVRISRLLIPDGSEHNLRLYRDEALTYLILTGLQNTFNFVRGSSE